jgi:hypothetical protein
MQKLTISQAALDVFADVAETMAEPLTGLCLVALVAAKTTPDPPKAARYRKEKDEGEDLYIIGLPDTWTLVSGVSVV